MSFIEKRIIDFLKKNGAEYSILEHEAVYTCEVMAKLLNVDQDSVAKSMMLKKSDGGYLLAVLPGGKRVDLGALAKKARVDSLSLAPIAEAEQVLGCSVGCVYPLGNVVNTETYFDKKLLTQEHVFFNPGSHTKSIKMNPRELARLVRPIVAEFTTTVGERP